MREVEAAFRLNVASEEMMNLYGRPSVGAPSPDNYGSNEQGAPTERRPYRSRGFARIRLTVYADELTSAARCSLL